MVMFDSLNRHLLPPYASTGIHAPNFERLATHSATFDRAYIGSMPCMPARRELHTGRYNFLHRSWGPLEPFDDSMPQLLAQNGIHTHLVTDHYHYWEDGGATYHNRYTSYELVRGQEGDPWKGDAHTFENPPTLNQKEPNLLKQDFVNRRYMQAEADMPQSQTFSLGEAFIRHNHDADNWLLQIETFDPHEPFFAAERFRDLYPHDYDGPLYDWPPYARMTDTPEQEHHIQKEYAALVSMCDANLGRVLDLMDQYALWDDTLLIVNTDHGYLLGEHGWWSKTLMPFYNEISNIPLFIWDPRSRQQGVRRQALTQTIDLAPPLLDYFNVDIPNDMQGVSLRETVASDTPVRDHALFGIFGGHINITDGQYVYMRAPASPENAPLYEYTLMPTHMRAPFAPQEFAGTTLQPPFTFTKHCPTMRISGKPWMNPHNFGTLLYDIVNDSAQEQPIQDDAIETRMVTAMSRLMAMNDAPTEQFERIGLPLPEETL